MTVSIAPKHANMTIIEWFLKFTNIYKLYKSSSDLRRCTCKKRPRNEEFFAPFPHAWN